MKVVIVGGVAGGASAAARLRRLDEEAEIILLERGEYISYANCGLPYYIGGVIREKSALTLQTPESFRTRFCVDVRTRHEVLAVDAAGHQVTAKDLDAGREYGEHYDRLILSPGAEPVRPALPGVDDPRVFTLRSVPDAYRIREHIERERPRSAVIIGGGFIGLEMAENLSRAGLSVTVAEAADQVLPPLDREMAADVHHALRAKGVRLLLGSRAKAFRPGGAGLRVELEGGELQADLAVLSMGVRPESGLARAAGLACGERGAVLVDKWMRTSDPDIYAVGDAVQITGLADGAPGFVPLAGPANKQGRIAADNICGLGSAYRGTQGSSVVKLFDTAIACTGLNERAAKQAGLDCDKVYLLPASHAAYYPGAAGMSMKVLFQKGSGRILGAQIVGGEGVDKRCDVLAVAVRAGMTADDLAELELCYAPPFSAAKDPVNMAGFLIQNLLGGLVQQYHWHDVDALPRDGSVTLLDVRTPGEYGRGHIQGAVNIPLDDLRDRLGELPREKAVYVNCQSGLRSYLACRILTGKGYDCRHLAGGWRLYEAVRSDREAGRE